MAGSIGNTAVEKSDRNASFGTCGVRTFLDESWRQRRIGSLVGDPSTCAEGVPIGFDILDRDNLDRRLEGDIPFASSKSEAPFEICFGGGGLVESLEGDGLGRKLL